MDEYATTLDVKVAVGPDGDAEELAQAAWQLRREFLDLDVQTGLNAVGGRAAAGIPGGGRRHARRAGGQPGRFAAARRRGGSGPVVAGRAFSRRSIKLGLGGDVLELTGVSSKEQRRLTDEWLARHAGR